MGCPLGHRLEVAQPREQVWRIGDQRYYVSDTRKFAALTGWRPRVSVADGMLRLTSWLREVVGSGDGRGADPRKAGLDAARLEAADGNAGDGRAGDGRAGDGRAADVRAADARAAGLNAAGVDAADRDGGALEGAGLGAERAAS